MSKLNDPEIQVAWRKFILDGVFPHLPEPFDPEDGAALIALDRLIDPPTSFGDDGVLNIEPGIDPGTWGACSMSERDDIDASKTKIRVEASDYVDLAIQMATGFPAGLNTRPLARDIIRELQKMGWDVVKVEKGTR